MVKKFFSNLEDVPMLPADVEIPTKGLDTDEQIDDFDAKYGIRTEDMIKAAGDDRAMLYSGVGGGRRKIQTDAISGFGMFTTNKYVWDWKGGAMNGTSVASYYNLYPIPVSDINNNKNMSQNEGYK